MTITVLIPTTGWEFTCSACGRQDGDVTLFEEPHPWEAWSVYYAACQDRQGCNERHKAIWRRVQNRAVAAVIERSLAHAV